MNSQERRRQRLLKAIMAYQERLDRLDPANYEREVDYRRLATFYRNRIAGLRKLLGGDNEWSRA
jgi:hypothetical protein